MARPQATQATQVEPPITFARKGTNQPNQPTMNKKTIAELWLVAVVIDTAILVALIVTAGLALSK